MNRIQRREHASKTASQELLAVQREVDGVDTQDMLDIILKSDLEIIKHHLQIILEKLKVMLNDDILRIVVTTAYIEVIRTRQVLGQ